jgi:hypothetical protein
MKTILLAFAACAMVTKRSLAADGSFVLFPNRESGGGVSCFDTLSLPYMSPLTFTLYRAWELLIHPMKHRVEGPVWQTCAALAIPGSSLLPVTGLATPRMPVMPT